MNAVAPRGGRPKGGGRRIDVLYPHPISQVGDGVRDHGEQFVTALNDGGYVARHAEWAAPDAELIVLQYSPFAWGRYGLAPSLPFRVAALRRRHPRPRIAVMVHEPFLVDGRQRDRLLGLAQREQLRLLCALVDVVLVSIEPWQRLLDRWKHARPVSHLPVGSNLPDERAERDSARQALGLAEDDVVLAAFDSPHPGRSRALAQTAARAAADAGASRLLLLGAEALPPLDGQLPTIVPGALSAKQLARHIAAADIFIAPFVDGVSTRRTTMVAALQHGLPVVGTIGHLTDPALLGPGLGLSLAPLDRPDVFGSSVALLVHSADGRAVASREARALFEQRFAWPVLVDILSGALAGMSR